MNPICWVETATGPTIYHDGYSHFVAGQVDGQVGLHPDQLPEIKEIIDWCNDTLGDERSSGVWTWLIDHVIESRMVLRDGKFVDDNPRHTYKVGISVIRAKAVPFKLRWLMHGAEQ